MKTLDQLGLLIQDHKQAAEKVFKIVQENMALANTVFDDLAEISRYLELSRFLNKSPKDDLINWFKVSQYQIPEVDLYYLNEIAKSIPLNDSNIDLFQVLIDAIAINTNPKILNNTPYPDYWATSAITLLQSVVPNGEFTRNQLEIIQKKWVTVCDKYQPEFGSLIFSLDKILKSKFPLPVPDNLMKYFNVKLADFVATALATKPDKHTIASIRDLDKNLPANNERNALVGLLLRMQSEDKQTNKAP